MLPQYLNETADEILDKHLMRTTILNAHQRNALCCVLRGEVVPLSVFLEMFHQHLDELESLFPAYLKLSYRGVEATFKLKPEVKLQMKMLSAPAPALAPIDSEDLALRILNSTALEFSDVADLPYEPKLFAKKHQVLRAQFDSTAKYHQHQRQLRYLDDFLALYQGQAFYMRWFYDDRGRMYPHGYYINPQGDNYHKAQVLFSHKELIE